MPAADLEHALVVKRGEMEFSDPADEGPLLFLLRHVHGRPQQRVPSGSGGCVAALIPGANRGKLTRSGGVVTTMLLGGRRTTGVGVNRGHEDQLMMPEVGGFRQTPE